MNPSVQPPFCATCREPIGVDESLWLRLPGGTLLRTSLLKIDGIYSERQECQLFHLRCLTPERIP
jgi:hypothetical protein